MRRPALTLLACIAVLIGTVAGPVASQAEAAILRVAVASNFRATLLALQPSFEDGTGIEIAISTGSTGLLAGQIRHGAPFDVLLAADSATPERLLADGYGAGAPFVYAVGRIVVVLPDGTGGDHVPALHGAKRIAIANPRTAPYGRAAVEVLGRLGIDKTVEGRLIHARNVNAVLATVESGAAEVGFVAASALIDQPKRAHWVPDPATYTPLAQKAMALNGRTEAAAFLSFLRSAEARAVIMAHGYGIE